MALQLTRNPTGIASALKKMGGMTRGSRIVRPGAEMASHMFFGDSRLSSAGWYATHPPVVDRVRKLEPSFDGKFSAFDPPPVEKGRVLSDAEWTQRKADHARRYTQPNQWGEAAKRQMEAQGVDFIGMPGPRALDAADDMIRRIPVPLREAMHDPQKAPDGRVCAVVRRGQHGDAAAAGRQDRHAR